MPEAASIKMAGPMRVLIVEDERRLCELWQRELREMGAEGIGAGDGEEALAIMERSGADMILLDLNLPRMDGLSFLERVRARCPDVPVVIITAHATLESAQRAIHLGVSEYLRKPCYLSDLEAAIARVRVKIAARRGGAEGEGAAVERGAGAAVEQEMAARPARLSEIERGAILAALERFDGNRSAAARALGISRRTLYNRLDEYRDGAVGGGGEAGGATDARGVPCDDGSCERETGEREAARRRGSV